MREQELAPCRDIIEKHTAELMAKLHGPTRKPDAPGTATPNQLGLPRPDS